MQARLPMPCLVPPGPADVAPAGALLALGLVEIAASDAGRPGVAALLTVAFCAPLVLWRTRPLAALVGTFGGVAVSALVGPDHSQSAVPLALALATFGSGRYAPGRRALAGLGLVAGLAVALVATGEDLNETAIALVVYGGAWAFGFGLQRRGRDVARLRARAEHLDRERVRAVEDERVRMARELHDVVSHSLSLIAIQTQAVRRRLGPGAEREAEDLAGVETAARQALAEMRRLLGVLRGDGDEALPLAPQPGLGQLERLVDQTRAAGLDVAVEITGEDAPLAPGVDLAAYRIVQEALTNVRRHARAHRAVVRVGHARSELRIVVEDDGRGMDAGGVHGHGLVGMRERITLYGGTLRTAASASGGARLEATLPLREAGLL